MKIIKSASKVSRELGRKFKETFGKFSLNNVEKINLENNLGKFEEILKNN